MLSNCFKVLILFFKKKKNLCGTCQTQLLTIHRKQRYRGSTRLIFRSCVPMQTASKQEKKSVSHTGKRMETIIQTCLLKEMLLLFTRVTRPTRCTRHAAAAAWWRTARLKCPAATPAPPAAAASSTPSATAGGWTPGAWRRRRHKKQRLAVTQNAAQHMDVYSVKRDG